MDNIQRQRGVLQNICLAMKGGVPSQTADGFIFFSSTSGEPLSFDSIMKWRKKVLSICHHIGGSLYIALCDRCNNYSAGAFVFCPYCSKDGNPYDCCMDVNISIAGVMMRFFRRIVRPF